MSAAGTPNLPRLAEIAGAANVLSDPAHAAAYEIDGKSPAAVVRPGTSEEVVEIVKFAVAEKLAIVPSGARTKLGIGMPPRKYDVALDMTRMNRIVAYDPGDLTLSIEPGIPLHKITSTLAEHGQFLPLAVPFMERATAGGTIASGVDSPLRQIYGTARDFVLGMDFITGDGTAAKSGGRVVKNVTGYDIHKMMIGALGTLGIITKINFRTFPLPRAIRTLVATFRGPAAACEFRGAIARSAFCPQSIEILAAGSGCAPELGRRAAVSLEDNCWSVVVSFAGDEQVLERTRRELQALARGMDGGSLESFTELRENVAENVNRYIAGLATAILEHSPAAAIFKVSTLPTDLAALAASIQDIEIPWFVMMRGLGVTYLALLPRDGSFLRLKQECARIFSISGKAPWARSVLVWCPPELKREINVWGTPSGDFQLMCKLKDVFDPRGVLSPGRFMGGI